MSDSQVTLSNEQWSIVLDSLHHTYRDLFGTEDDLLAQKAYQLEQELRKALAMIIGPKDGPTPLSRKSELGEPEFSSTERLYRAAVNYRNAVLMMHNSKRKVLVDEHTPETLIQACADHIYAMDQYQQAEQEFIEAKKET